MVALSDSRGLTPEACFKLEADVQNIDLQSINLAVAIADIYEDVEIKDQALIPSL